MALTLADVEAADDADAHVGSDLLVHQDDARAKWHSIRPWHPRLSLSVAEITSVSATFLVSSLSSSIRRHHDGFDTDDDIPTFNTEALSKGVSVTVNGTPWRKCLARLADDADEATIIIHGLMPGRHYDIELGIIPGDEKLKGQIVTESESTCLVNFNQHSYSSIIMRHQIRTPPPGFRQSVHFHPHRPALLQLIVHHHSHRHLHPRPPVAPDRHILPRRLKTISPHSNSPSPIYRPNTRLSQAISSLRAGIPKGPRQPNVRKSLRSSAPRKSTPLGTRV
jgi:hypothetical protein